MRFDSERAAFAREWIETHCCLYEGELAGRPLRLLPFQVEFVSRLFGWVRWSTEWGAWVRRFTHAAFWAAKKNGKPVAVDTLVPTTVGLVRMGDLTTDHVVFDENGKPTRIVAVSEVMHGRKCYRMTFGGGVQVVAADDHKWAVQSESKVRDHTRGTWVQSVRTTEEIAEKLKVGGRPRFRVKVSPVTQTPNTDLPVDPYWLGFWLGNGKRERCRGDVTIRTSDVPTVLPHLIAGEGEPSSAWENPGESRHYYFSGVTTRLRDLGLNGVKFVPEPFLQSGTKQRWALLQGLMDSDGCVSNVRNQCIYATSDVALRDGVVRLLSSLGFKATWNTVEPSESNNLTVPHYRVLFTAVPGQPISRLPRKLANLKPMKENQRSSHRMIEGCEPCESVPVRCIQVEASSSLFLLTEHHVPTHNSPLCAAVNLYLLCGDGEQGQKVYQAAKNGEQARIAQRHAFNMVKQSPALAADCKLHGSTLDIFHKPTNSILTVLTGDDSRGARAKEGLNGSVAFDEMHVVDREMYERVSRAGISRKEPLLLSYSTAGDDPSSVGFERCKYGRQVNSGDRDDPHFLHVEYAAPEDISEAEIDANIEEFGRAANPAWNEIVKPSEFKQDWQRSKGQSREVARFLQYRGNRWVGSTNRWLDVAGWDRGKREYTLADLADRECFAALDLSRTRDMTACVLMFPWPEDGDEVVRLWPMLWLPEDTAKERDHLFPLMTWARAGHLRLTPGGQVDYGLVKADVRAAVTGHNLNVVGLYYDEHYANELTQALHEGETLGRETVAGVVAERIAFPQTLMHFTGPAKEFERRVSAGKVHHPGNPVLTWQAGHCEVWGDRNQNIRPVKPAPHSGKSVDAIVCGCMAMAGVATYRPPETSISSYLLVM